MQLQNGYTLKNGRDPYLVQEKIGQGGFGITYRAFWKTKVQGAIGSMETKVPVVVKEFFWKDYCAREEGSSHVSISSVTGKELFARFKEKLKKEAKILSRLSHPNIVSVLDIFEENNTAYMVLQLVEGESLKDKIARLGKLDESSALKYTQQLCSALCEVHRHRILHLDIKPGNVIIDKKDNAQLLDFGISKQYDDKHQETSTTPIGISKGYAPIEQYSGLETFSPPTDVYALGATLYTMLTGQVPPEATQLVMSKMEPVQKINSVVSNHTAALVAKAMEINPISRFQTIQDFLVAINDQTAILTPSPPPEPPKKPEPPKIVDPPKPAPKQAKYILIVVGTMLLIVLGAIVLKNGKQKSSVNDTAILFLQQADSTFNDRTLRAKRFDDAFELYKKAKDLGADVSAGRLSYLSTVDSLIKMGADRDAPIVKKLLEYAEELK
ncbi:MAG: serine/threonine protein kinase [Bacteroidales bacterium]|nr:serine/threonine protein kinase [Bacteroidales bacterium]